MGNSTSKCLKFSNLTERPGDSESEERFAFLKFSNRFISLMANFPKLAQSLKIKFVTSISTLLRDDMIKSEKNLIIRFWEIRPQNVLNFQIRLWLKELMTVDLESRI